MCFSSTIMTAAGEGFGGESRRGAIYASAHHARRPILVMGANICHMSRRPRGPAKKAQFSRETERISKFDLASKLCS